MKTYNLDDNDLNTLTSLTDDAIRAARGDDAVPDDALSRLYALKGKLSKIRESRAASTDDEPKPKKVRKARKSSTNVTSFPPEA